MTGEEQRELARLQAEVGLLRTALNTAHEQNTDLTSRVNSAQEDLIEARGAARLADGVMAEIRAITAERAVWEVEALRIRDKYMPLVEATKNELRAAQKGLTSGCGCPIGQCLNPESIGGTEPACWMQWALTRAIVMAGTLALDKMKADSMHPRRFTHANRKF